MAINFVQKCMRADEVAEIFGVHPRTVKRWFESGTTCLEVVQFGDRTRRFTPQSVERFVSISRINSSDLIKD